MQMIEYFIWAASFFSLFLGIFWINVLYINLPDSKKIMHFPSVSILIPAYNEEDNIAKTIRSAFSLNYPKDKLKILVVNDDSKDNTKAVVESTIKEINSPNITLINRKKLSGQTTKAPALNEGLKHVKTEYVACIDADTLVNEDCFQHIMPLFTDEQTGAVISAIKPQVVNNFWEKIQRFEYIFAQFIRKLMGKIETLHTTPGALSVYRTNLIKKFGGFDEDNITEDLEIAMRLKFNNYKIKMAFDSITYTKLPESFKGLWNQRVRWFRGFIHNNIKYRKMFMNKNLGMMGTFQYPINLLSLLIIIITFSLLAIELSTRIYNFLKTLIFLKLGSINLIHLQSLEELLFKIDLKLFFPIFITFALTLFIYHKAHQSQNEKWRYPLTLLVFFSIYPVLRSLHWVTAVSKEIRRAKNKW